MKMKRGKIVCACVVLAASFSLAQTNIQFTAIHASPSNQVELTWSSDIHRWYIVESGSDLLKCFDDFDAALPNLSTSSASNTHEFSVEDSGRRFFRITGTPSVGPFDSMYSNGGTAGDDFQIRIGTTNSDMIIQFGQAGNDTQYASGGGSNDWIEQHGGSGTNSQQALGGTGHDVLYQEGGESNDTIYANAGDGNDWIIQHGGDGNDWIHALDGAGDDHLWQNGNAGDDDMGAYCSDHDDTIVIRGGEGQDAIQADGGLGDDSVSILANNGSDEITYDVSLGRDAVHIDGGADADVLRVREVAGSQHSTNYLIKLADGTGLYTSGVPDTVITVVDVEQIHVVATNGMTNWSWSAP